MTKIASLIENAHWSLDYVEEEHYRDRGTLQFNFKDGRYHIWLAVDPETHRFIQPIQIETSSWGKRKGPVLYKNPRLKADGSHYMRGEDGYFETKKLDANTKANAKLITEAIVKAGDLKKAIKKAKEAKAEKDILEEAARLIQIRQQAMQDHASELFDALVGLLNTSRYFAMSNDLGYRQDAAEAVLKKIKEAVS